MSVSVSVRVGDEESRRVIEAQELQPVEPQELQPVEPQELLQIPASSSCPNGMSLDVRERRESCCARSIHTSVLSAARCLVLAPLLSSARSTDTCLFSLLLDTCLFSLLLVCM